MEKSKLKIITYFTAIFFLAALLLPKISQAAGEVATYSFNEGSGATAADTSGNSNTGTISGAAWTTQGKYGNALSFDGVNDYVNIGSASGLGIAGDHTISAWIYPRSVNSGIIVQKDNDSHGWTFPYSIMLNSSRLNYQRDNGTQTKQLASNSVILSNTWQHIAVQYQGTTMRIYINGILDNSQDLGLTITSQAFPLGIGASSNNGNYFNGLIDEVRIYSRALSQSEIQTDMNTPIGGTPLPPPTQDIEAPTMPTDLSVTAVSSSQINLSWTASTDNVGVTGYRIYRGGTQIGASATNSYSDTGLSPNTTYTYYVVAYDAAGNESDISTLVITTTLNQGPYPLSSVIETIVWDQSTYVTAAPGSDIWPITWGADGNLYAGWGDGEGFPGGLGDSSWGVARIQGIPPDWSGVDLFGKLRTSVDAGKITGLLGVNGTIYLWLQKQDDWKSTRIVKSSDNGNTWSLGPYILEYPLNRFTPIQFGPNYEGARDSYIYGYLDPTVGTGSSNTILYLARVPTTGIESRSAYEVFSGFDVNGNPKWSANLVDLKPVFTDSAGVKWGNQAVYHPALKRYLLAVSHGGTNGEGPGLGVFDAPEPWGPWTTAYYTDAWKDTANKFSFSFPQKWMSADGKSGWMIHSGWPEYDGYHHVKYALTLKVPSDITLPTTPTNLIATTISSFQINLSWTASSDNVGVTGYRVERCQGPTCTNFSQIATPSGNSYSDAGLSSNITYRYQVRATDATGNLSSYSSIVSATTQVLPTGTNIWTQLSPPIIYPAGRNGTPDVRSWYGGIAFREKSNSILFYDGYLGEEFINSIYANTLSSWNVNEGKIQALYITDTTPPHRHTYEGFTYVDNEDALYIMKGAYHKTGLSDMWKFTFSDNRWQQIQTNVPGGYPYEGHLVYWKAQNKLLYIDGWNEGMYEFNLATKSWSQINVDISVLPSMFMYDSHSTWDTKRDRWVFWKNSDLVVYEPATRKFSVLPVNGTRPGSREESGITYIPKYDAYLIAGGIGASDTWVYEINNQTWKSISSSLPSSSSYHWYLQYVPALDKVFALSSHRHFYEMKFVGDSFSTDTIPPATPTGITVQ